MHVKLYGPSPEGEKRYNPAECIECHKHLVEGHPDRSTQYVLCRAQQSERQNHTRRVTRLTNAFSKKVETLRNW